MNDGYAPWPSEMRARVVEHAPRGFGRVAVPPARGIERVAEVGRFQKLGSNRGLCPLKPRSRDRAGCGFRIDDELTQSAAADQPAIRLAHYREEPEVRPRVHRDPFDPRPRFRGRSRSPVPDVPTDLNRRVETHKELGIVARDPAQHEPLGFDPISARYECHEMATPSDPT